MHHERTEHHDMNSFSRPRYFHGQLLDVRHFESEQAYFQRKHALVNRLILGFGVVCGLDVQVGDDQHSVIVLGGIALDKRGHEIVVPGPSRKIPIDPATTQEGQEGEECRDDEWVHLVLCYQESKTEPEPVLTGGCDVGERCAFGAVREGYELHLCDGKAPDVLAECGIQHVLKGNSINYRALVEWVSAPCDEREGSCITLANIRRPGGDANLELGNIDISVRPIVFGLDLLWELVLALTHEAQNRRSGKY